MGWLRGQVVYCGPASPPGLTAWRGVYGADECVAGQYQVGNGAAGGGASAGSRPGRESRGGSGWPLRSGRLRPMTGRMPLQLKRTSGPENACAPCRGAGRRRGSPAGGRGEHPRAGGGGDTPHQESSVVGWMETRRLSSLVRDDDHDPWYDHHAGGQRRPKPPRISGGCRRIPYRLSVIR